MGIEGEFVISSDKARLSLEKVVELLGKSYWAVDRTREQIAASITNSLCFGVYHNNEQVGFARVITDYATMYWLCDVIIARQYRGLGLGKRLVRHVVGSEELKNLAGVLKTRDAHGLYEQYGFRREPERMMRKDPEGSGC
jgi:GNAT superfamily N-acetyltransferase